MDITNGRRSYLAELDAKRDDVARLANDLRREGCTRTEALHEAERLQRLHGLGLTIKALPVRRLLCCCCGAVHLGRQWHNRDTGYGLCPACIDFCSRTASDEDMHRRYGVRGVHYDIKD